MTAAVVLMMAALIQSSIRKRREYKNRDAARKLELVLQPRESIKVICPRKKGRVILTSKRILFETKGGFNAVPIKTIKKVQGNNEKGNRTTVLAKMVSLTIKAEQEYEIKSLEFEIKAAKHMLDKYEKELDSDEIDELEDEIKDLEKELEEYEEDYEDDNE